ncbi:uncharacterized protein [Cherax quadricarinatus]|uniref:uncharacterized protein isoform X2 n=1 Tax=Cherax quadricarinatus TaxID=27406 RepID=UPI002379BEBB|nr:uncharacterized protein LOC128693927 isoform X2 [Cherax quadricarinatus]
MPYRLRVTVEEVREELALLGFRDVADETVESLRKDLLKLIKNDLRKVKLHKNLSGDLNQSASHNEACAIQSKFDSQRNTKKMYTPQGTCTPDLSEPQMQSTRESSVRHREMHGFTTQKERCLNKDAEESGYSDFESTASATSETNEEESDSISVLYLLGDKASAARLPKKSTRSFSGILQKNTAEDGGTTSRDTDGDSQKVPTVSVVASQLTQQCSVTELPKRLSDGSKLKQNLGQQKFKATRDRGVWSSSYHCCVWKTTHTYLCISYV